MSRALKRAGSPPLRLMPRDVIEPAHMEAIAARLAAATPGPWTVGDRAKFARYVFAGETGICVTTLDNGDAEFIAHAREDVSWLQAQLAAARQALVEQTAHAQDFALALHDYQRRMDFLETALDHAPDGVCDMLGLESGWEDLDAAVDHAIAREEAERA